MVQAVVVENDLIIFVSLSGATICSFTCIPTDHLAAIYRQLEAKLSNKLGRFDVVLPAGDLWSAGQAAGVANGIHVARGINDNTATAREAITGSPSRPSLATPAIKGCGGFWMPGIELH